MGYLLLAPWVVGGILLVILVAAGYTLSPVGRMEVDVFWVYFTYLGPVSPVYLMVLGIFPRRINLVLIMLNYLAGNRVRIVLLDLLAISSAEAFLVIGVLMIAGGSGRAVLTWGIILCLATFLAYIYRRPALIRELDVDR